MNTYTPGPWHIENAKLINDRFFINDSLGYTVTEVVSNERDYTLTLGNAQLIANLPELLAELKNTASILEQENGSMNRHHAKRIRATIAKAEGRP